MSDFLIVLNKDEDSISIVDLDQRQVVKTISCSHNPHEIAISPDGKKSFIACSLGQRLDVLDHERFEIVASYAHPDFDFPHGVNMVPQHNELWLASTYSEKVLVFNLESNDFTHSIATGQKWSHMIAPTPDGSKVFVPNIGSDNITVLDTATKSIVGHFEVGKGPEGLGVHPNGKHLYVANQHDNNLFVIDVNTFECLYKRRIGACPIRMVFTSDGQYALIPNRDSGDLSVIHTAHLMKDQHVPWEIKRIPVGNWPGGTVIDPEDRWAYVANNKTNDISIIDLKTLKAVGLIDVGIHPDGMAFLRK